MTDLITLLREAREVLRPMHGDLGKRIDAALARQEPAGEREVYRCESCGEEFNEPMPAGHAVPKTNWRTGEPYPEQCGPVTLAAPSPQPAGEPELATGKDTVAGNGGHHQSRTASQEAPRAERCQPTVPASGLPEEPPQIPFGKRSPESAEWQRYAYALRQAAARLQGELADCAKMLHGEHDAHMECHRKMEEAEAELADVRNVLKDERTLHAHALDRYKRAAVCNVKVATDRAESAERTAAELRTKLAAWEVLSGTAQTGGKEKP